MEQRHHGTVSTSKPTRPRHTWVDTALAEDAEDTASPEQAVPARWLLNATEATPGVRAAATQHIPAPGRRPRVSKRPVDPGGKRKA